MASRPTTSQRRQAPYAKWQTLYENDETSRIVVRLLYEFVRNKDNTTRFPRESAKICEWEKRYRIPKRNELNDLIRKLPLDNILTFQPGNKKDMSKMTYRIETSIKIYRLKTIIRNKLRQKQQTPTAPLRFGRTRELTPVPVSSEGSTSIFGNLLDSSEEVDTTDNKSRPSSKSPSLLQDKHLKSNDAINSEQERQSKKPFSTQ